MNRADNSALIGSIIKQDLLMNPSLRPEFPYRIPRESDYDFQDLFVLDLANNHQGDVAHGRRVIQECGAVVKAHGVRGMFKFQFRDLDTLVHLSHQKKSDNKHIPRFLGTRLSRSDFQTLFNEVRAQKLLAACTPFDENSVTLIKEMGFDVLKIASCSATDWPLLERAAESGLPVIFSTGGLTWEDIDNVCSFFEHRHVCYAIMHCVSIYPTPDEHFQLNQIDLLKRRYPGVTIGFSTHEKPEEILMGQLATAKGAAMFERHVGVATDKIVLNAYSATPAQLEQWFAAIKRAKIICGVKERGPAQAVELESLQSLKRGVYARRDLPAGEELKPEDVYFAMPMLDGQLSSGEFQAGTKARTALSPDAPLLLNQMEAPRQPVEQIFYRSIHEAKGLLNEARIALGSSFSVEFSHHYGLERFREVGAIIIDCVNRSYCKKLVIQVPGQRHPAHYHKRKEETFQVLHGILDMEVDGQPYRLYPGQTILIQQGVWHRFTTPTGVIFEEISTTHIRGDSYYEDKIINSTPLEQRKTKVENWGRYQLGPSVGSR
jgi:N-acetylneuraminate synthase